MLTIVVPGKGTAKFSFFFTGPEGDGYTFITPQVKWNDLILPFTDEDAATLFRLMQPAEMLFNIARASGVDTSNWVSTFGSTPPGSLGPPEIIQWFLSKPKAEIDRLTMKWWTEILAPKLAAFLTRVLGPARLATTSTASDGYASINDYLAANLAKFSPAVANGVITLTR
jgi:hypothetical protein